MRDDQAAGLRRLFAPPAARVLLVAWDDWPQRGWLALNLAAALSRAGEQVMVLDAERESLALLWGSRSRYDLAHVIRGDRRLPQVQVQGPETSLIVPMRRAGATLASTPAAGQGVLAEALSAPIEDSAILVVPLARHSLASPLWRFAGGEQLVCAGTGRAAITGAYAAIKSSLIQQASVRVALAADGEDIQAQAGERFAHLARVTRRFLGVSIRFGGGIPAAALRGGTPGLTLFDERAATAAAVEALAASACSWKLPRLDRAPRHSQAVREAALSA
ncbi:MAG: hypothetical protein HY661_02285 [Betaproteobacteria bacterium]|nr:hypothetical protein [Betaproteobacteria bacterium]